MRPVARLAVLGAILLSAACATNFSEARPARILARGQVQVTQANNIVVPLQVVPALIEPGKAVIDVIEDERMPTVEETHHIVGAATAIALTGPGYGTHLDVGVGLGHSFDLSGRVGNGIYAASVRRGFAFDEKWHGNLGMRGGYNAGGSWLPYFDRINEFVSIGSVQRFDLQAWGQVGREFGRWGRIWGGAKVMNSRYRLTLDAKPPFLREESTADTLSFAGGFGGVAVGYRFVFFVMELTVLYARGTLTAFERGYDLSGLIIAPTWGFQGTWGGGA